jgi:hypothetical protein
MGLGRSFGVKDDLGEPLPVSQINKDQAPVITPSVHPTSQSYLLSFVFGSQFAASVSFEHKPASPSGFSILYYREVKKTSRLRVIAQAAYAGLQIRQEQGTICQGVFAPSEPCHLFALRWSESQFCSLSIGST